jgi:hypothetical protein
MPPASIVLLDSAVAKYCELEVKEVGAGLRAARRDASRKDGRLGDPTLPSLASNSLSFKGFRHQFLGQWLKVA